MFKRKEWFSGITMCQVKRAMRKACKEQNKMMKGKTMGCGGGRKRKK